jgi:hypothetical protein
MPHVSASVYRQGANADGIYIYIHTPSLHRLSTSDETHQETTDAKDVEKWYNGIYMVFVYLLTY